MKVKDLITYLKHYDEDRELILFADTIDETSDEYYPVQQDRLELALNGEAVQLWMRYNDDEN